MTSLASTADYEAFTGQNLDKAEIWRVQFLLDAASEAVLARAHDQNIVSQTYTDATLYGYEGAFIFPQRPVTEVTSVEVNGSVYTDDDYRFTPGGNRRPALLIRRVAGRDMPWCWHEATVTYTAGWETTPAQIKAAVVAVASGAYRGSIDTVVSSTAGGAPVAEYPAQNLNLLAMKVTPAVQAVIDQICGVRRPASVEIGRG